jgi:DNA polymerase III subunit delta
MSFFFYWGNDEFAIAQAVAQLRQQILDPAWESFNADRFAGDQPDAIIQALNQAMTAPFGSGDRFVWLSDTTVGQRCPEEILSELERTLPQLPTSTTLVFTSRTKPDSRLKATKLLQKHAAVQEFSLIPAWNDGLLLKQVQTTAQSLRLKMTPGAAQRLAAAVGNDTRQLYNELEKLRLFIGDSASPVDEAAISAIVTSNAQTAFQLAETIRLGQTAAALELLAELLGQNEPALRIVSALVGQFRLWVWVKLLLESGERDDAAIAQAADLANPKRLYYIKKEVQPLKLERLLQALPLLLELEFSLKRGADDLPTLQTKLVQLCQLCQ